MPRDSVRFRESLRVAPAMAAGVTGRPRELRGIAAPLDAEEHIQEAA